MEQLLPGLLSFPPHPAPAKLLLEAEYDGQIQTLLKRLDSTPASQLTKLVNGSETVLDVLDPAVNTLPFLYALLAHLNMVKDPAALVPGTALWAAVERFVANFDPVQVRYAGAQWKVLVDQLLDLAKSVSERGTALLALDLVQKAMVRLDPDTSTFTSTHLTLITTCLSTRQYQSCLVILGNDIYHYPSDPDVQKQLPLPCGRHGTASTFITTTSGFTTQLSYRDHLQYFLLGAMVYISQKVWARALAFLELVLTAPVHGNTVSLIQVEAYKKYTLVSLILHGRAAPLPRTISPQTSKYLNALTKPYILLAEAFAEESPGRLHAEFKIVADASIWQKDSNMSLVKLVLEAHRRFEMLRFSSIYASIPLKSLSASMGSTANGQTDSLATVEADIRSLVGSGSVNAAITHHADGAEIVRFLTPSGKHSASEAQRAAELRRSLAKVTSMDAHITDARSRLEYTREYVESVKRKRRTAKESSEDAAPENAKSGGLVMDEDMLAEY